MGRIQILDEHIANQIAAGEVVERPSSVVKELVENAIDAGSTTVDVSIEEGGLQLIRVSDNGSGMEPDDCETAFYRHATSKLLSGKDLFQIRSLGFRGEALPSIAAVSKVLCISSHTDRGLGRRIVIEGGSLKTIEDTTASRGTTFEVRELFFNTPARLKYMKTIQTELGHISDFMYRLALAHPGIAFTLRHNGNQLLQTGGNGDLLQVIAAIYGTSSAKMMLPIKAEHLDYTVSGYVGKPELTRANRNGISLIINGRYIRNFAIVNAMLRAYHTLLPIHRFPLAVLHIQMHPSLVDVNVHPSKLEVRFSKEVELCQFIENTLKQVLQVQVLIPEASKQEYRAAVIQEKLELYRTDVDFQVKLDNPSFGSGNVTSAQPFQAKHVADERTTYPAKDSSVRTGLSEPRNGTIGQSKIKELLDLYDQEPEVTKLPEFPKLHPIGQMHGTYIVAQNEKGLYLIDQHAAHERINYEYYYEQFGNPKSASQELLIPLTIEFTPTEVEQLQDKLIWFEQAGVSLEAFGGNSFLVRSYPYWFPEGEERGIILDMAEWILTEKKQLDLSKLREQAAILCSCKASIKANQYQTLIEIEALLDRLSQCRNPYTCPHGRPIVVSFSTYELEKMFKRVM